jgi:hypothetical protein
MDVMNTGNSHAEPFRTCGACGRNWETWQDFVYDPQVRLLGMQAIYGLPDANLIVFEHRCGSSISVLAHRLRHLLPPDAADESLPNLFGTETCSEYCRFVDNLAQCDRPCTNARDRRLTLLVHEMKRARDTSGGRPE